MMPTFTITIEQELHFEEVVELEFDTEDESEVAASLIYDTDWYSTVGIPGADVTREEITAELIPDE
tara:strand:+ start:374 stop:571 length:198 start_codon:yes stop_codon:yes gene_type:complete